MVFILNYTIADNMYSFATNRTAYLVFNISIQNRLQILRPPYVVESRHTWSKCKMNIGSCPLSVNPFTISGTFIYRLGIIIHILGDSFTFKVSALVFKKYSIFAHMLKYRKQKKIPTPEIYVGRLRKGFYFMKMTTVLLRDSKLSLEAEAHHCLHSN